MMINLLNFKKIVLIILIFSMTSGIVVVYMVLKGEKKEIPSEKVIKIADTTYSKNITLKSNQVTIPPTQGVVVPTVAVPQASRVPANTPIPTDIVVVYTRPTIAISLLNPSPTSSLLTNNYITPSPTNILRPSTTPKTTSTISLSPTPTKSLVAKAIALPTSQPTASTKISKLPIAGYFNPTLVLGLAAALIILVSFVI